MDRAPMPLGWYQDPLRVAPYRYWDGARWTPYVANHERSWIDSGFAAGPGVGTTPSAGVVETAEPRHRGAAPGSEVAAQTVEAGKPGARRELTHVEYLLGFLRQAHDDGLVLGRQLVALRTRAEERGDALRSELGLPPVVRTGPPAPEPVPRPIEVPAEREPVVAEAPPAPAPVDVMPMPVRGPEVVAGPVPPDAAPAPIPIAAARVEPTAVPPVVTTPPRARRPPGRLARLRRRLVADLAVHWLAYLGVVLLFAGVFGFVAFTFNEVRVGLRPVAEVLIPLGLFAAARFLRSQRAPLAGRAVEVLGGLLLPIVAVAAFNDGSGIPPDFGGAGRALAPAGVCLLIAAGYVAATHRDPGSPLRFLAAPTVWFAVGVAAFATRPAIPTGSDVASMSGWQVACMASAILVTVVVARRRRPSPLVDATLAVTLPGLGIVLGMAALAGLSETWATGPGAMTALVALVAVEQLRDRIGARSTAWMETALLVLGVVALAPDVAPGWQGAIGVVGLLALAEWSVRRDSGREVVWAELVVVTVALVVSLLAPWSAVAAFGAAAAWVTLRRVRPTLPVGRDVLDAAAALLPLGVVAGLVDAMADDLAILVVGVLVLVGTVAVRVTRTTGDRLYRWLLPVAVLGTLGGALGLSSVGDPWLLTAAAGVVTAAAALLPLGPPARVWITGGGTVATGVLLADALGLGADLRAEGLATAGLLAVGFAAARRGEGAGHTGIAGHAAAIGAVVVAATGGAWAGAPGLVTLGAFAAGWLVTAAAVEMGRSSTMDVGVGLLGRERPGHLDALPAAIALVALPLVALDAFDVAGVVEIGVSGWAIPVSGTALLEALVGIAIRRVRILGRLLPDFAFWTATVALAVSAPVSGAGARTVAAGSLIGVVLLAGGRRRGFMAAITWPVTFVLAQGVSELLGVVPRRWNEVIGAWGALLMVGSLVVDELRHGRRCAGQWVRNVDLAWPVVSGAVAVTVAYVDLVATRDSERVLGWWTVALAVLLLVIAVQLRVGALSGGSAVLGVTAVALLAPVDLVDEPWVLVVVTAVLSVAAMGARLIERRRDAAWFARWDLPPLVVAHGTALVTLVVTAAADGIVPSWIEIGVVSLLVGLVFRGAPWLAAGAALVLVGVGAAGPGWRTLSLGIAAAVVTTSAARFRGATRTALLVSAAVLGAAAFTSLADWLVWSDRELVAAASAIGGSMLVIVAGLARVRIGRTWTWPWAVLGVTGIVGSGIAVVLRPGLGHDGPGYVLASAAGVLALAAGGSVRTWEAGWLRETSAVAIVIGLAALGNAAEVSTRLAALGATGIGLAGTALALLLARSERGRAWTRAALVVAAPAAIVAPTLTDERGLVVLGTFALSLDILGLGVAWRRPAVHGIGVASLLLTLVAFGRWLAWTDREWVVVTAATGAVLWVGTAALVRWRGLPVRWVGAWMVLAVTGVTAATVAVVAEPVALGRGAPGFVTAGALLAVAAGLGLLARPWAARWLRDLVVVVGAAAGGVAAVAADAGPALVSIGAATLGALASVVVLIVHRRTGGSVWLRPLWVFALLGGSIGILAAALAAQPAPLLTVALGLVAAESMAAAVEWRTPALSGLSSAALLGAVTSLGAWVGISDRDVVVVIAIGAAALVTGSAVAVRVSVGAPWVWPWLAPGLIGTTAAVVAVVVAPADVAGGAVAWVVTGASAGVAIAVGMVAQPWLQSGWRIAATGFVAAAIVTAGVAAELSARAAAWWSTGVGFLVTGAVLGLWSRRRSSPWILAGTALALVLEVGAVVATGLIVAEGGGWSTVASPATGVLLGAAVQAWALGTVWPRSRVLGLTPILGVAAWCAFAAGALGGNAQWYTVPVGIALLVVSEIRRADRRTQGVLPLTTDLGRAVEYLGMTLIVAASCFQTIMSGIGWGLLGVLLGAAITLWGIATRVRRRAFFGAVASGAAALLTIAVPLVHLAPEVSSGAGLWIVLAVLGFLAILVASLLERGIRGVRRTVARVADATSQWE